MTDVHVISSDSDDDQESSPFSIETFGLQRSTTSTSTSTRALKDISSSDDEILPLFERLKKCRPDIAGLMTGKPTHNCPSRVTPTLPDLEPPNSARVQIAAAPTKDVGHDLWVKRSGQSTVVQSSVVVDLSTDEDVHTPSSSSEPAVAFDNQEVAAWTNVIQSESDDENTLPDIDWLPDNLAKPAATQSTTETQLASEKATTTGMKKQLIQARKDEKLQQKEEKLQQKEEKLRQKEANAVAEARHKLMKEAVREENRNMKPGLCIKFVKVILELSLLEVQEAQEIPQALRDTKFEFAFLKQPVPRSITWKRIKTAASADFREETVMCEDDEDQIVVLESSKTFLEAVYQFKQAQIGNDNGETLLKKIQRMKASFPGKSLTLVVTGTQKYIHQQSKKTNQKYRSHVLNDEPSSQAVAPPKRSRKIVNTAPADVSRLDVEEALVDLQIKEPCNVRLLESSSDVATLIASFSKSIAEAPYKKLKYDDDAFSWYAHGDTRNSVKVDKNGTGLRTLWQRQLQQLNLVSADVAQAIISEYQSPRALVQAYSKCGSTREGESLLKDIMVRRGVTPLATTRRIGSELSRKIHLLMTGTNGMQGLDENR